MVKGGGNFALARLNGDGIVRTDPGDEERVNALALQPNGRLQAAGVRDDDVALARFLGS